MVGRRLCLLLVACALALSACDVDATVTVAMRHNGSGAVVVRVVLDREAVRAAQIGGGKLADRVRLADLPAAGWHVTPWRTTGNGGATLVVRKPFTRPAQVAGIVAEINGASGPLRGFRASRDASTFSTTWKVHGSVDLRKLDLGVAADPDLLAKLTAERVDIPAVEQRVAGGLLSGLHVRAVAELPGSHRAAVATPGKHAVLVASADETDTGRVLLLVAGIGVGALALVVLVVGERRARRRHGSVASRPGTP